MESHSVHREHTFQRELYRKYLVCSGYFDWNAHSELLVLVLGRVFVLLN